MTIFLPKTESYCKHPAQTSRIVKWNLFKFLPVLCLLAINGFAQDTNKIHSELSFTDWYVGGLQGSPEGAFSFASKAGLTGVEINPQMDGDSLKLLKSKSFRQSYVDAGKKYGVRVSTICMGDLYSYHPVKNDNFSVKMMLQSLDLAVLMNVRSVTIPICGPGDIKGDKVGTDSVVARMKRVAPKAESLHVILAIEHFLNAEENNALLDRIGSPNVQDMYDIGNSFQRGYPIYKEIRFLKGTFPSFHCKDYTGLFGTSKINFDSLKQALIDVNYTGWTVLELDGSMVGNLGQEKGYKYDADYLKTKITFSHVPNLDEVTTVRSFLPTHHLLGPMRARIMPLSFERELPGAVYILFRGNEKSPARTFSINGQIVYSRLP